MRIDRETEEGIFALARRSVWVGCLMACVGVLPVSARSQSSATSPNPSPAPAGAKALPSRIDPKAQQILDQTLQALGGQAFLEFRTLTTHGRAFSISDGSTAGLVLFDSAVEYPNKRRLAYGSGRSKPVILYNDGDQAWEQDRYGTTRQRPDEVRHWQFVTRYSLENLLRLRIHEPGVLVQAGGVDFVDNVPTQILDIFDAQNVQVKLYIDKRNHLPVQIAYRVLNPQNHEWDDYADSYSDYQMIDGVNTPMHIARFENGERVAETFRNSAKYNEQYPEGYFRPGS